MENKKLHLAASPISPISGVAVVNSFLGKAEPYVEGKTNHPSTQFTSQRPSKLAHSRPGTNLRNMSPIEESMSASRAR